VIVRVLGLFLVVFGLAIAVFGVAKALGLDQSWHNGLLISLAIAALVAVLDVLGNRTGRLPTSR
jgi:hypothetical protein